MADEEANDDAHTVAKPAREPISKKLRFETFKRDKFTCQYCGAKAPEAVLHVDHIHPVAAGGKSDPLNLVTSCAPCNSGKGAIPLGDRSAVEKQRAMIDDLHDRREQLEMLLQWRNGLQGAVSDSVDAICVIITSRSGNFSPNENGRADIKRWLKRFPADLVMRAVDEAFDAYLEFEDGLATSESWNKAFAKVTTFASILQQEEDKPYLRKILYIQGIIRQRIRAKRFKCIDYLEHLVQCGADIDEMERLAKAMRCRDDFEGPYDKWLDSIGEPF